MMLQMHHRARLTLSSVCLCLFLASSPALDLLFLMCAHMNAHWLRSTAAAKKLQLPSAFERLLLDRHKRSLLQGVSNASTSPASDGHTSHSNGIKDRKACTARSSARSNGIEKND